jgi:hypothetical protein
MHYHLFFGEPEGPVLGQIQYEEYEDSIHGLVMFSRALFSHINEMTNESLSQEYAEEVTEYGQGKGAYVGTTGYIIYWSSCEQCRVPQMN